MCLHGSSLFVLQIKLPPGPARVSVIALIMFALGDHSTQEHLEKQIWCNISQNIWLILLVMIVTMHHKNQVTNQYRTCDFTIHEVIPETLKWFPPCSVFKSPWFIRYDFETHVQEHIVLLMWCPNKIAAGWQTTFLNAIYWLNIIVFWFKCC